MYAFPFNKYLCAGKTDSTVSSFGAPRYVDGVVSRKVCVTAIAIIIMHNVKGENMFNKSGDNPSNAVDIKLTWIPGVNPVNVPKVNPIINEIIISKII